MPNQVLLLNHNQLAIVHHLGTLTPPSLYIAVDHCGYPNICDSCHLQADCHEVFGDRGEHCPIHKRGERWKRILPDTVQAIKNL